MKNTFEINRDTISVLSFTYMISWIKNRHVICSLTDLQCAGQRVGLGVVQILAEAEKLGVYLFIWDQDWKRKELKVMNRI